MADTKPSSSDVPDQQGASKLAEAVRGYEEAKISGLCHEGAWECAVSAMRMFDIEPFVQDLKE